MTKINIQVKRTPENIGELEALISGAVNAEKTIQEFLGEIELSETIEEWLLELCQKNNDILYRILAYKHFSLLPGWLLDVIFRSREEEEKFVESWNMAKLHIIF